MRASKAVRSKNSTVVVHFICSPLCAESRISRTHRGCALVAALVVCAGGLLPPAVRAQHPLCQGRVLAPSGDVDKRSESSIRTARAFERDGFLPPSCFPHP